MATWQQLSTDHPDLVAAIEARLRATKHHVLATLRRDGSPRVSGTEVQFHDGDLCVGMMHRSMKALDLLHDGRFALHSNPGDGSMAGGDGKVGGVAHEVTDPALVARYVDDVHPPEPFHVFRLDVTELVLSTIHPDGDRMVIESWHPSKGRRRVERA